MDQTALLLLYKKLFKEFVSFKSVSTDPQFQPEIKKTALWLQNLLKKNGFTVEIVRGFGNPLVLAEYKVDKKLPTVLIYGHYDVQPAEKHEGWTSDPFVLTERGGRLYGRGAVDNKGQILIYLATVISLIKSQNLKYNIKFLIEGDEETGSDRLGTFIKQYKKRLAADLILVSDGEITAGNPVIEVGFRGVINVELSVTTSAKDNHSGLYGGVIPNAVTELSRLLAALIDGVDGSHHIAVPGFYDNLVAPSERDLKNNEKIPFDVDKFYRITGARTYFHRPGWSVYTQLGFAPSVEVTGISGGYTGAGFRNSVPGTAAAKLNVRLVRGQTYAKTVKALREFVAKTLPDYCTFAFAAEQGIDPIHMDVAALIFAQTEKLLQDIFKKDVLHKYCGATIPIANYFAEHLVAPQLYVPLCNEDCNMHGANENFTIALIKQGLTFAQRFFRTVS